MFKPSDRFLFEPMRAHFRPDEMHACPEAELWIMIVPLRDCEPGDEGDMMCQVPPVIPQTTEETR